MTKLLAALAFLSLNFYVYHFFATDPVHPPRSSFAEFPMQLGAWECPEQQTIGPEVLENLGVTDYLVCNFRKQSPAPPVNVYIGYHDTQIREAGGGGGTENSIHPPAHCLPGSGWDIIDFKQIPLEFEALPEQPAQVNRVLIAKGDARQLVYYWYQSRGRVIADDWKKILFVTWDRARLGRTDGSLVRFTTSIGRDASVADADERIRELARRVLPRLSRYVPE